MTSRNKPWKFIFIACILILAYVGFYNSNHNSNNGKETEVKATVDKFFKELKSGNIDNALEYAKTNEKYSNIKDKDLKNLINIVLSKIDYKIEDISVKDSLASVKVKIETIDLFSIYNKYSKELNHIIKKYISGNENQRLEAAREIKTFLYEKVENDIKNGIYDKFQGTTKINLVLKDGKWVIDAKDELMYYLTGKLSSVLNLLKN